MKMRFREPNVQDIEQKRAIRPAVGDIVSIVGVRDRKYKVYNAGLKVARVQNVDDESDRLLVYYRDLLKEN